MFGFEYEQFPKNKVILNHKLEALSPVSIGFHYQQTNCIDFIPLIQIELGPNSSWSPDLKSPLYRGPFKRMVPNDKISFYEASCLLIREIKGTFWIYKKDDDYDGNNL